MMSEGLFISVVGMAMVFVVLIIIMFLMMGIERLFREDEGTADLSVVAVGDPELTMAGARREDAGASTAGAQQAAGLGGMLMTIGVELQAEPEGTAEVAAIALALAAHLSKRGSELGGRPMAIGSAEYAVEAGDPWSSPVAVSINGERCWGSLDGTGLPVGGTAVPTFLPLPSEPQSGRQWRSAQPIGQGGIGTGGAGAGD
jgi:hypothetical protein